MTQININKGDTYYIVDPIRFRITKYEYLCPFPTTNKRFSYYHIVINRTSQQPERIWHGELQQAIKMGLNTHEQAHKVLIENCESFIHYLKNS